MQRRGTPGEAKLTPPGTAPKIALLFPRARHEEDLPTKHHQTEAHAWFPSSHGDPRWSQGDQRQACQRAQAPLGVVPPALAGRLPCVFPATAACVASRSSTGCSRRRNGASARVRSGPWRALTQVNHHGSEWSLQNGSPTAPSIATGSSVASGSRLGRTALRSHRVMSLCS